MSERLELPDGEVIDPGDVILFEGYPYRYVAGDADREGIVLSPIHWGGSDLDLRFESRAELVERWGEESEGALSEAEWRAWIDEARASERFGEAEIDAVERAVLPPRGLLDRLRRLL